MNELTRLIEKHCNRLAKPAAAPKPGPQVNFEARREVWLKAHPEALERPRGAMVVVRSGGCAVTLTGSHCVTLRLIVLGCCNKQIAAHLSISVKTVEKHRQELMNALGVHSLVELVHYALATGLVPNLYFEDRELAAGAGL